MERAKTANLGRRTLAKDEWKPQGAAATVLINKLIDILGLLQSDFLHGKIVQKEQIRLQVAAQLLLPGIISFAPSQVRQEPIDNFAGVSIVNIAI